MPLVVNQQSGGAGFKLMPKGIHQAVIVEVKELELPTPDGLKKRLAARCINANGEEATRWYSPSLHEKSNLYADLDSLYGKVPKTFDVEKLVGVQVKVGVKTGTSKAGKATATVDTMYPADPGQNIQASGKAVAAAPAKPQPTQEISDADIPW